MNAECCAPAASPRSAWQRARTLVLLSPLALLAALVPKCPLCLAAPLALLLGTFSGC